MEESWSTIESDPGVFTALMQEMGVRDVQVEELYSLESEALHALQPVYGLVFLFKYQSAPALETPPAAADDSRVFFAQQVIPNACATQAILSVLLNRPEIEIGPDLTSLKEFTADFPPDMRGHAIGNSETIRRVHNSFHPPDPIATEDLRATEEDDEAFHFVSYVPFEGAVYELDGLTPGPLRLGSATEETWLDVARPRIQQRIEAYSGAEIRFNLMAIVKNRVTVAKEALEAAQELQEALSVSLLDDSSPEERATLEQTQHQISSLQAEIMQEESKFESWRNENIRRKTNYMPFIFTFLQTLAERGKLQPLIDAAVAKRDAAQPN